jgi:hypothetical protein
MYTIERAGGRSFDKRSSLSVGKVKLSSAHQSRRGKLTYQVRKQVPFIGLSCTGCRRAPCTTPDSSLKMEPPKERTVSESTLLRVSRLSGEKTKFSVVPRRPNDESGLEFSQDKGGKSICENEPRTCAGIGTKESGSCMKMIVRHCQARRPPQ